MAELGLIETYAFSCGLLSPRPRPQEFLAQLQCNASFCVGDSKNTIIDQE